MRRMAASVLAPKFPQPLALRWLLRRGARSGDAELVRMATAHARTAWRPAASTITWAAAFIVIASTARWLVPHFEKMLYDNALLATCYLEAWQATGNARYAAVVRQTLDYLLRRPERSIGRSLRQRRRRQ